MTEIISFIILHYNVYNETIMCVESIKKLKMQNNIRIVIIDNASPNNSGEVLLEKYKNDLQVHVILNKDNMGFSAGNNIGCLYAKRKWNPLFYVVTNNDVIFPQEDFVERTFEEYEKWQFDILGMDIFCSTKGIHQSPLAQKIPSIQAVNKTIFVNRIMLRFFNLLYPIINLYFKRIDQSGQEATDYDKFQKNVCIMGACMVLSEKYMDRREKPFWPETKFYYEEFLLSLWCRNHDARVVYQPEIKVIHNEGAATKQVSSQYRNTIKFRIEHIVDSAEIYREELQKRKG